MAFSTVQLFAQADKEKLMGEINGMNAKLIKASVSGDLEAISQLYTEDVYYMPNYSPMTVGMKAMMESEKESQASGYKMLSLDLITSEVFSTGKMVIEIGEFTASMSAPGMAEPMNDKGKYVTIWERQKDGALKIKIDTWNTDVNPMAKMMESNGR